jgi:hypothetical protein
MADDAAHIASVVSPLVDAGKEIVLVAHSYGGVPVTESIKGLSLKERASNGQKGGIKSIVYFAALVPKLGESCGVTTADGGSGEMPDWIKLDVSTS